MYPILAERLQRPILVLQTDMHSGGSSLFNHTVPAALWGVSVLRGDLAPKDIREYLVDERWKFEVLMFFVFGDMES